MQRYIVTMQHDAGIVNIHLVTDTKENAIRQACNVERAPRAAVVKVTSKPLEKERAR